MKRFKIILLAIVTIVGFGCEKESADLNLATAKVNNNEVQAVLNKGYAKINQMTDSEYFDAIEAIKDAMYLDKVISYKTLSGGESIPLEDIFFYHEGIINSIYISEGRPTDELGIENIVLEVPIFTDDENNYYIEIDDFETFYGQIVDAIDAEVDINNNEYLSVGDLQLIDITSNSATVSITLVIGTVPPANPTGSLLHPAGAIHGALQAGPCASNNPGIDAADFLRGYINGTGLIANTTCPPGTTKYVFVEYIYTSYSAYDHVNLVEIYPPTDLLPYIWKDNINSCIGDDNQSWNNSDIWHLWYARMDHIADLPLDYVQTINPSYVFLQSTYHSHDGSIPGNGWSFGTPSYQYYHGGLFLYGRVLCQ